MTARGKEQYTKNTDGGQLWYVAALGNYDYRTWEDREDEYKCGWEIEAKQQWQKTRERKVNVIIPIWRRFCKLNSTCLTRFDHVTSRHVPMALGSQSPVCVWVASIPGSLIDLESDRDMEHGSDIDYQPAH